METIILASESDIRRWLKDTLVEYFEGNPIDIKNASSPVEGFLNRKEVAGIFHISIATLHVWMNKGLPFHKHRGRVYFIREEIISYVKDNSKKHVGKAKRMSLNKIS
jgi:hypothetical protein